MAHNQTGSVTGHAQRNKGLELVPDEALVCFVDGDNIVHPNFYHILALNFTLGKIFSFDSFYKAPSDVLPGNVMQINHIDTGMFAVDRRIIGDIKWQYTEYNADGRFVEALMEKHSEAHVYLPIIAAFYNFSKQNFTSLTPGAKRRNLRTKTY